MWTCHLKLNNHLHIIWIFQELKDILVNGLTKVSFANEQELGYSCHKTKECKESLNFQ